jgi:hypothetical protein
MHSKRRRGLRPGKTIKYLRRTTSGFTGYGLGTKAKYLRGAAGIGLGFTIKYLRGAAGICLGTTIKYLRRLTSGAAGKGLRTTIKYLRRSTSGAAGNGLRTTIKCLAAPRASTCQVPATHTERRCGKQPGHHDQVSRQPKRGRGQQLGKAPLHKD